MGDHEELATQMPGGVKFQSSENQQVPVRPISAAMSTVGMAILLSRLIHQMGWESPPIVFLFDGDHLRSKTDVVIHFVVCRILRENFQYARAFDPVKRPLAQRVRLVPPVHDLWALHSGTKVITRSA